MSPPPRAPLPRRVRWLVNALGIAALAWTAYCVYAWWTRSGPWKIVWDAIASHQRATPDASTVALIAWGLGLGIGLVVGWPALRLLRRGTATP
jgi:hypothetical protein